MPVSMLHTLASRLRQNVGRSLARLAAEPEYPDNDFADDPAMQAQQSFLTVRITPDDALHTGSGFAGTFTVPLSRVLPLVPKSDMDLVTDALDLNSRFANVRKATETQQGCCDFRTGSLDISAPSYNHCAARLVRAARDYNTAVSRACAYAAIDLRRSDAEIHRHILLGAKVDYVAGKDLSKVYDLAKSLRASTEATRELVREYDRASDMLAVHCYLAARKAGDQATMDSLREESAVSLFLRCGDLDA